MHRLMLLTSLNYLCLFSFPATGSGVEPEQVAAQLKRTALQPLVPQNEVQRFCDARIPRLVLPNSSTQWEEQAARLRERVLKEVVFRGRAKQWRDAKCKVEWFETVPGGDGYSIRKLRYEALPGMWIPALLYWPDKIDGRVAAVMNVNGHERGAGKGAYYKQTRCINQAKRGIIALNVEWLGMGQLHAPGFGHYRMNQLDLCGDSGIAPFYLAMSRGLDVLLSLKETDPQRVAVAGLSGGGWQTIFISSLDPRVTLCNPVAGYSSFVTRVTHHGDLGDSEQTPCDLATVVDYTHLTAMLAPRPALLTFNLKDTCCFASPHAMLPLQQAARPAYALFGKTDRLAFHVNEDPGNHNFGKDNREALYRMLKIHFFPGVDSFSAAEIPVEAELKTKVKTLVPLPDENVNFQSLAEQLCKSLPQAGELPTTAAALTAWQADGRRRLAGVIRAPEYQCRATERPAGELPAGEADGLSTKLWQLKIGADPNSPSWTVPAIELTVGKPDRTVIVIGDGGRASLTSEVTVLLNSGAAVIAVDPFYFGESKIPSRDFLFGLLVGSVGQRPLGIQARQVQAVVRWVADRDGKPPQLAAHGPRTSLIALVAAALTPKAVSAVQLHESFGSLKQVIENGMGANQAPELFCFGLLQQFDILQLAALAAPRELAFVSPSQRVKDELAPLAQLQTLARAAKR